MEYCHQVHRPRLLGVLAGDDFPISHLSGWTSSADIIIAADGAANRLIRHGILPSIVIGDMDSIDQSILDPTIECLTIEDQETTDADKLLALVADRWPGSRLDLVGLEGDRFDHVLANVQTVAKSTVDTRIILRSGWGWILRPGAELIIAAETGDTISAIALEPCDGFELRGVRWIPARSLSPTGAISISNECTGQVTARLLSGVAFVMLVGSTAVPNWSI